MAEFCVSLDTCEPTSVPLTPYGNHAQLEGGSVAEILMSTLAYGWEERCSDIAGCKTSYVQDKCYCLCYSMQLYFLYCKLLDVV